MAQLTDYITTSKAYEDNKKRWEQIKYCIDGEEAIKEQAERFLPYPVAIGDIDRSSDEFVEQYDIYKSGAHFVGYTAEAVDDLTASAFRKDPTIEPDIPADLEYYKWIEESKTLTGIVSSYGMAFVLVDYPNVEDSTLADDKENFAFSVAYEPLDVLDYTEQKRSGKKKLTRVLLSELDENDEPILRELLVENGVYIQRIYEEDGEEVKMTEVIPIASGSTLDFIPGTFVGVTSNSTKVDKSPVIGISNSNIKHYQTWAELIWTQTYTGHPQLALTGLSNGWNKEAEKKNVKIKMDASQVLALEGETADAKLLEINTSNLVHFDTLKKLEDSMLEQGYRLKANTKTGVESAEAMKIRHAGDISKLGSIVKNIESAMNEVFTWLGMFMGVTYDPVVTINKEFVPVEIEGTTITALTSAENSNVIPRGTTIDYLKSGGLIGDSLDTDTLVDEIGEQNPLLPSETTETVSNDAQNEQE